MHTCIITSNYEVPVTDKIIIATIRHIILLKTRALHFELPTESDRRFRIKLIIEFGGENLLPVCILEL